MKKGKLITQEIISIVKDPKNKNVIIEDFKKKMILLKFISNLMTFILVAFIAYNLVLISNDIPGKEVIFVVVLALIFCAINTIKDALKYKMFINNKEQVVDKIINILDYDFIDKNYEKVIFTSKYYFGEKNINKVIKRILSSLDQ